MPFYSIASLTVEADALPNSYQPFLLGEESPGKPDLSFVEVDKPHSVEHLTKMAELPAMTVWKEGGPGEAVRWVYESRQGICTFSVNADYSVAEYYYLDFFKRFSSVDISAILQPSLQLIIQCKLVHSGITVLHAACVEKDGMAYAFCGPSGVGKSSRAQKWCEWLSAEWISGDRPAVDSNQAVVYGVPWDGKEKIHRNVCFPLAALLKVRRSETVSLNEMTESEKLQFLSEQTFFPLWDSALAASAMHSLRVLKKNIPVLELGCSLTDESTRQAHRIIARTLNFMKGIGSNEACT